MADLATLQAHRAALEDARASGERVISREGRRIEYRDIAELERAIAAVDKEIRDLVTSSKPSISRAVFQRG